MQHKANEELRGETVILGFLKHLFWAEPGKSLITEIQGMRRIAAEGQNEDEIDEGLALISESVLENCGRMDAYLEDLAVEYARLFIGPKKPMALPYATIILSDSKGMMSEVTSDVRKRYLSAGLAVKDLYRLPDDHVAIELEFLEYLARKIVELSGAGQHEAAAKLSEIRKAFLAEHFVKWVPEFTDNVLKANPHKLYRGAALMLKGFVSVC